MRLILATLRYSIRQWLASAHHRFYVNHLFSVVTCNMEVDVVLWHSPSSVIYIYIYDKIQETWFHVIAFIKLRAYMSGIYIHSFSDVYQCFTYGWIPYLSVCHRLLPLEWRHNERDGISNHQPHDCLLNRLFGSDQRKYQSSASLACVRGIHRWPVNCPHKGPVTRKMFPFDDVITFVIFFARPLLIVQVCWYTNY